MNAALLLLVLLASLPAEAHFGNGLLHFHDGLMHPITGLDHLAAAVAVGIYSMKFRGMRSLGFPAAFLIGMSIGMVAGSLGWFHAYAEAGIIFSVGALGALLYVTQPVPLLAGCLLAAIFGGFHGLAHGSEVAGGVSGGAAAGLLLSTGLLHAAGYTGFRVMRNALPANSLKLALRGTGVALVGFAAILMF